MLSEYRQVISVNLYIHTFSHTSLYITDIKQNRRDDQQATVWRQHSGLPRGGNWGILLALGPHLVRDYRGKMKYVGPIYTTDIASL